MISALLDFVQITLLFVLNCLNLGKQNGASVDSSSEMLSDKLNFMAWPSESRQPKFLNRIMRKTSKCS
jgi:hypothetical protein